MVSLTAGSASQVGPLARLHGVRASAFGSGRQGASEGVALCRPARPQLAGGVCVCARIQEAHTREEDGEMARIEPVGVERM